MEKQGLWIFRPTALDPWDPSKVGFAPGWKRDGDHSITTDAERRPNEEA
jgi:hypothetical protein